MTSYARPRVRDIPNSTGTRAAALDALITDAAKAYGATSVYDAKDILTTTQQTLRNRTNYAATAAQRGSTAGVDTNDPLVPTHTGEHYLWLPNLTGAGANNVYSTVTFPAKTGVTSWVSHRGPGSGPGSGSIHQFYGPPGAGTPRLYEDRTGDDIQITTLDDVSEVVGLSTALTITGLSSTRWVNVEVDWSDESFRARISNTDTTDRDSVVWGAWSTSVDLYGKSGGGVRWVAGSGLCYFYGSLYSNTEDYRFWAFQDGVPFISLDPSEDIDTSSDPDRGQTSWVSSLGNTWTVGRPATGLKTAVVTRPVMLFDGTDDYVQLPASDTPTFTATTGKHTVLALVRVWNVPNIGGKIYSSYSAPDDGIGLYYNTEVYARVGASGTALQLPSTATALQDGRLTVVGFVVDDGTVAVYKDDDGLSVAADFSAGGTITHAVPRFGSAAHSTSGSIDIEGFACLTFQDQAKTETELNAIAAQLLAGAYA